MRQKEEKNFCEIPNHLHKGQCTGEDDKVFQSCIVKKDSPEYKFNVRHIFPFANAVTEHNQKAFHQIHEYKVTIEAQDAVCGNPNEEER